VAMRRGKASEWTVFRQLAGNVLPFIHWLPTFLVAWILLAVFQGSAVITALVLIGVFASLTLGTWALFDRYNMFHNAAMRRALRPRLRAAVTEPATSRSWFVGMATEGHFSLLDTDEDVGYLSLHPDRLTYVGDQISLVVQRKDVLGIERQPIPGYGLFGYKWAVIRFNDAETGQSSSLRLLSREVDRLSQQPEANRQLWEALRTWYSDLTTAFALEGGTDALAAARAEAVRELRDWLEPPVSEPASAEPAGTLRTITTREELAVGPAATDALMAGSGAAATFVAEQAREMIRGGADWDAVRSQLVILRRCLEDAETFRCNYEVLVGVYLVLRERASEFQVQVDELPLGDALLQAPELVDEYAAVFPEAKAGEEETEAAWRALRRGRRMQALSARQALRRLLESSSP
jgi:hypothetical protein